MTDSIFLIVRVAHLQDRNSYPTEVERFEVACGYFLARETAQAVADKLAVTATRKPVAPKLQLRYYSDEYTAYRLAEIKFLEDKS